MLVHESVGFDGLEDLGKFKLKKLIKKVKGGMLFPKFLRRKHLGWKKGHPAVVAPAPPIMPAAEEIMYAVPAAPVYSPVPSQETLNAHGCYPYVAGEAMRSGYTVRTFTSPTGLVQYACPHKKLIKLIKSPTPVQGFF